jgi:hypothetical protein
MKNIIGDIIGGISLFTILAVLLTFAGVAV